MSTRFKIDWQEIVMDLMPLLLALVITRRLHLQGWRSLVAYVLIAGTTREVMDQLAKESENVSLVGGGPHRGAETNGQGKPMVRHPSPSSSPGGYHVIHTSPGRIRLRLPLLAKNPHYANDLRPRLEADERLQSVRINPHTASITVKYDVQQLRETEVLAGLQELLYLATEEVA
jgi:hypothetical protein